MADNNNIKCNFHNQDYKLYCKECKDCICLECLDDDLHHMHNFCKLKDARNDILKELQTFIAENGEHHNETADHFSKALKHKIDEFKNDEMLIKTQVIVGAEEMIRHIQSSKDELLSSVEKQFYKYNEHIKSVQDSLKTICSHVDNADPDTIKDDQVVNLLVEMKKCISTCKNVLSNDEKQTFVQNQSCEVGYFTNTPTDNTNAQTICRSVDGNDIKNKPHPYGVCVAVQTGFNDTEIKNEANEHETSSDEIQEDYPIAISLDKKEGKIDKIVPISDQDAWVIINRQLRKIKHRELESTNYAATDDFAVLKDGSVVVLFTHDKFIKKLLPDGRLVPFSSMNNYCATSLCSTDSSVFITLCYRDSKSLQLVFSSVKSFSYDGIISSTCDVSSLQIRGSPKSASYINGTDTSFCFLCNYHIDKETFWVIYRVSKKGYHLTFSAENVKYFEGLFGISPSAEFKCNGVCIDKNNTIVVSDKTYKCIYTLDENMKFKKFVVKSSDYNLESPGAIAIYNDHLWVADGKKIQIFRYDFTK